MIKNILIVEDNDDDSHMLSNVVEIMMKHKATVVSDGLEAIRKADETLFNLVFLDMNLPSLSGPEVAAALRQIHGYRDVPIIAVTAYDLFGMRKEAIKAGCNRYVTKPVDIGAIITLISDYLG